MKQVNEVIEVLKALGYEPKHNEEKQDVYFTSFGFEAFPERHKKVVRALLGKHRLLLLEEPFEYLDKLTAEILMKWLKKLNNTTILIVSNDEKLTIECDAILTL
jgi:ABC-type lipoprotein export system ATPase subunit